MTIRKYTDNDYSSLLNIYAHSKLDELKFEKSNFELLPLENDNKRLARILESDIYIYGSNESVAFCAYYGFEIRALFVHPKARGKGIGMKLLEYMLSKINGSATLYVAASNYPAIRLYHKYGFEIMSEFQTTYNRKDVTANKMKQLQRTTK